MATFKIEVDLDWINEVGEIDGTIKEEVISTISNRIENSINKEITEKTENIISSSIQEKIDQKVNEITSDLLNKEFTIYDDWGVVKREKATVVGLLKEKLDNFLEEQVDDYGKPSRYNGKRRLDYIISQNIDFTMKRKVDEAAKEIKKGLEAYIDTTLKAQIGENVAQLIGINNIKSKMASD